ncbi:Presenilin-domain-containing protein, partial [Chytriomyces sp. MP71]
FLGIQLLSTYLVPFDYITFAFFVWNIAATGLVSVFWKGPLWLQQVYMVFMSTLMALSLSSISAITSWILLSLLAVWDLIAVLCPYGPLKLLIESSQKNNRNIPALLYTESVHGSTAPLAPPADEVVRTNGTSTPSPNPPLIEDDDDEPAQSGMKLGLGDFVFYSVLAPSHIPTMTALLDWISTVTVVVAVVTGLNFTIFLLVLFQKALPALPISIVFGLLFYFVSFLTLVPLVNELMYLPPRLNVTPVTGPGSALWVGQNGGAGMVYL